MLTGALPGSVGQVDLEGNHSYKFIYSRVFGADLGCCNLLILLVGAARFELATPCAQGRCATRLRYAPTFYLIDSKSLSQISQYLGIGIGRTIRPPRPTAEYGRLRWPA